MAEPKIKLALADIDRTLLPWGQKEVPARTRAAFHHALEAGIHVGPATGRGYDWVGPLFSNDAPCYQTCVATNGNQVLLDGKKIREANFAGDALAKAAAIVRDLPHAGLIAFDGGTPTLVEGSAKDLSASFPAYGAACRTGEGGAPLGLPDFPVVKANAFMAEPQEDGTLAPAGEKTTRHMVDLLNREVDSLDFDYPQPGFSNVMPRGWSKASGILALVDAMGITVDDVVVFGDAGNDLSMFRAVPNSVAVANATPEASDAARWHIGACADEAVADALEALARGEWPFER